jgi:hypothetical protein
MTYTIIEDCSPYYIRFTWETLPELIEFVKRQPLYLENNNVFNGYTHWNYDSNTAKTILDKLPMKGLLDLNEERVALFVTRPEGKSSIHKDGATARCGINITIKILDDKCITSWYDENDFSNIEIKKSAYTRVAPKIAGAIPAKTMTAVQNECILFNTDIFHSWDNSQSQNQRIVLTFRFVADKQLEFDFEKVKNILFNN